MIFFDRGIVKNAIHYGFYKNNDAGSVTTLFTKLTQKTLNMKMKTKLNLATGLLASGIVMTSTATAATTIIGTGGGATNSSVDQTYGDNATANVAGGISVTAGGTPNIGLTYGGGTWEYHAWSGAGANNGGDGVLQLQGTSNSVTHSITFTPDAGFAAVITGFNFIGDTNGAANTYQYDWQVVDAVSGATLTSGTTASWTTVTATAPFSGAPAVDVNYTGLVDGQALRLEMVQSAGFTGVGGNMAIDNLVFDQVTIVPEPSSAALLGLGGLALILRRRK